MQLLREESAVSLFLCKSSALRKAGTLNCNALEKVVASSSQYPSNMLDSGTIKNARSAIADPLVDAKQVLPINILCSPQDAGLFTQ
jgi:hypothetical protein